MVGIPLTFVRTEAVSLAVFRDFDENCFVLGVLLLENDRPCVDDLSFFHPLVLLASDTRSKIYRAVPFR